jgi:hypothetical protein
MHQLKQDLPVTMEAPGTKMHNASGWGGMVVGYIELPAGTDFTPLLEGLPNDKCQCPHWGYVTKGAIHLRYADGAEEVTAAGEVFYRPAGHTAWVEEDTALIDFSPEKEHKEVTDHVARKMEQLG